MVVLAKSHIYFAATRVQIIGNSKIYGNVLLLATPALAHSAFENLRFSAAPTIFSNIRARSDIFPRLRPSQNPLSWIFAVQNPCTPFRFLLFTKNFIPADFSPGRHSLVSLGQPCKNPQKKTDASRLSLPQIRERNKRERKHLFNPFFKGLNSISEF